MVVPGPGGNTWGSTVSGFRKWGEKIAAAILLLAFSPLLIIVAVAIKLDSRGPVLFRQVRIGLNEEPFVMFKFRTMHVGSEKRHKELVTQQMSLGGSFLLHQPDDPRTTQIGRLLRKLSLDELPQFLNVLHGSMSLVGPRPMMPEEIDALTVEQRRRFTVLPGITGWAQVNGRSALGAEAYLRKDLEYLEQASAPFYWKILVLTPLAVITGYGAV